MRFLVLGPLEVRNAGCTIDLPPKRRDLLAVMLCRPYVTVSAGRLTEELWGGRPPRSVGKTLQGHVHHLRRALGDDELIAHRSAGYVISPGKGRTDAGVFEELAAAGRTAIRKGRSSEGIRLIRQALSLWRGRPYEGQEHVPAVHEEVMRLTELRHQVIEECADAGLALGRHAEVAAELRIAVAENPFRERARAQLMLALYRMGRPAEALEIYREGRDLLVRELGLEPGPALTELERAVLRNDPLLDAPALPAKVIAPAAFPAGVIGRCW